MVLLSTSIAAQTARIRGVVLDANQKVVPNVNISFLDKSTATNSNGFYELKVPANQNVTLVFTHVSLKKITVTFFLEA